MSRTGLVPSTFPALAVVDVDLFNYCLCVRYLVSCTPPGAFTSGPIRYGNATAVEVSGTRVAADAIVHRNCVVSYRTSPEGSCVAGSVTLPTPLRAGVSRVTVSLAPLTQNPAWCDLVLDVMIRIGQGRVRSFSTCWSGDKCGWPNEVGQAGTNSS